MNNSNSKKCQALFTVFLLTLQFLLMYVYFSPSLTIKYIHNPFSHNVSTEKSPIISKAQASPSLSLRNEIWEQMNENVFFKRTSAFYIIERKLLRIFFIAFSGSVYSLNTRILLFLDGENQFHHIYLNNGTIKQHAAFGYYAWKSLTIDVNILKFLKLNDFDQLLSKNYTFHMFISDSNRESDETLHPIEVNMKYIRKRPNIPKENAIVCSKCFWYKNSDYKDFVWWVELHKQAGYKKIQFCNNSIPNTREFNAVFEQNKDFIEVSQLNYLPNFMNNNNRSAKSHNYLNYFHQMGSSYPVDSDVFNMMITNECFLNNTHEFIHVAVVDNDEIIMPRVNSKILKVKDNFNLISGLKFEDTTKNVVSSNISG